MNTIIHDNLYLILIVAGSIFVSIHSRTLYSTPLIRVNADWLGKDLQLQNFTGKRRFEIGYLFYLCPILLIYLIISISPELLSLSMGVAGTTASVGALSLSVKDASTFAPILAAIAVNTLISIKPVSMLEQYIRGISHGIAGIPHYLQRMVRKVREATQNLDSLVQGWENPAQQSTPQNRTISLQQNIDSIRQLNELTLGSTGGQIWSGQAIAILDKAYHALTDEYNMFLIKVNSFDTEREKSLVTSSQEQREDESGEIILLATNLRRKYIELLAITITNQEEPLPSMQENPELKKLLLNLVTEGQRIRKDRALVRLVLATTLTGFGACLLPATLFYFTLFVIHDWSINNFSLGKDETTLLIRGMPMGAYYQSTLFTGFKLAWWNVLTISLLFGAGCTAALSYRANARRVGQWETWEEDAHPVGQYVVISLIAVLFATFTLETLLFLKLVVLPAGRFSGADQFATVLQDFNLSYLEYGFYGLLAAPFAVLLCYLSDKMDNSGNDEIITAQSHLGRIVRVTIVGGMVGHIGIMAFLDGTHEWKTTLSGAVVPAFTLFVLAWQYWIRGLQYQYKTGRAHHGDPSVGMYSKTINTRHRGARTESAQADDKKKEKNVAGSAEDAHVEN